jgi:hypothetical protein
MTKKNEFRNQTLDENFVFATHTHTQNLVSIKAKLFKNAELKKITQFSKISISKLSKVKQMIDTNTQKQN